MILNYGKKHRGTPIEVVARTDTRYALWLLSLLRFREHHVMAAKMRRHVILALQRERLHELQRQVHDGKVGAYTLEDIRELERSIKIADDRTVAALDRWATGSAAKRAQAGPEEMAEFA